MATNSSSHAFNYIIECTDSKGGELTNIAFMIFHVLFLLPLSLLVVHLGVRRWRQQGSPAAASHSDVFTYHFSVMELIFVLGSVLYLCGTYFGANELLIVGYYACTVVYPGQMYFQILTCAERYLAVVHPITYLGLRQSGGVRIRNVSVGCSWLLYCLWIGVEVYNYPSVPFTAIACFLVLATVIVSFCSISALCVLIRPGPGKTRRGMTRLDQSKQRAFYTITAITAVLWLYFLGACLTISVSNQLSYSEGCLLMMSASWFSLPSSLVLPLLFLHRAGKLLCCHSNSG